MNRAMFARAASLGTVLLTGSAFLGANSQIQSNGGTVAPAGAFAPTLLRPGSDSTPFAVSPAPLIQQNFVFQVEAAGLIEVNRQADGLAFGTATPADGWTWEADVAGTSLSGTFTNGTTTLLLMIVDNDGSVQAIAMEVGSGESAGPENTFTRPTSTSRPTIPPAASPTKPPLEQAAKPQPVVEPVVAVAAPTTKPVPTTQPAPTAKPAPTTQPARAAKPAAPTTTEKSKADRNDKKSDDKKSDDKKSDKDDDEKRKSDKKYDKKSSDDDKKSDNKESDDKKNDENDKESDEKNDRDD